jgi:catechol 2,3-dioxygenase-like lactoylglutathione lyase family enzyme
MGELRVRWVFHATAAVPRHAAALAWFERVCGLRELEYSDHPDPLVARKGGCSSLADGMIELMEPTQESGPPARGVARLGHGLHSLALQVEDLGAGVERFRALGLRIVGDPARGWCFTHPGETEGIHLEWADKAWSFDPRFGAALPARRVSPRLDPPRIAWLGALVRDPAAALARLQRLWPAPVLFEDPRAGASQPECAIWLGDTALALYRLPADAELHAQVWGPLPRVPRLHLLALRVRDLGAAREALARERVRTLREDPAHGAFLTHPADTQGCLIAWSARELRGDPRGSIAESP